jgi:hypothetical protein
MLHARHLPPMPVGGFEPLEGAEELFADKPAAEDPCANLRAENDALHKQIAWTVKRCNEALGDGFSGTPNSGRCR